MPRVAGQSTTLTFHESLYDGESHLQKMEQSGDVYQFRMFIKEEGKHYRKSLKTKDYDIAIEKAKKLTRELMANGLTDTLVFSISVEELIEQYIAYRENDIDVATGITRKRWLTLASKLKYLALTCGADTNLSDLKRDQLYKYSVLRKDFGKSAFKS